MYREYGPVVNILPLRIGGQGPFGMQPGPACRRRIRRGFPVQATGRSPNLLDIISDTIADPRRAAIPCHREPCVRVTLTSCILEQPVGPGRSPSHHRRAQRVIVVLSTHSLEHPGYPFGSVVPYVLDQEGLPLLLLSRLPQHTKNPDPDIGPSGGFFRNGEPMPW